MHNLDCSIFTQKDSICRQEVFAALGTLESESEVNTGNDAFFVALKGTRHRREGAKGEAVSWNRPFYR